MPELPEVETMVRGVRPHLAGREILEFRELPTRCRPLDARPSVAAIASQCEGRVVTAVRRLGKRLVWDLSDESTLTIEPRMTGLVLLDDPPSQEHLRFVWRLSGWGRYNEIWFWDRRGLGTLRWERAGELAKRLGPGQLGRDALEMTVSDWTAICRGTSRAVKTALLDQSAVAGIGNLYASEILFAAGIHPDRAANGLSRKAIERLSEATREILRKAIEYEGSTLGDGTYRNALSQSGRYQNEHRVYMKTGEACPRCGRGRIERLVQAQRSTFFCGKCQR